MSGVTMITIEEAIARGVEFKIFHPDEDRFVTVYDFAKKDNHYLMVWSGEDFRISFNHIVRVTYAELRDNPLENE